MPFARPADRPVLIAATLLLGFVLALLPTTKAHACSCAFMQPEEALNQGNVPAAFVGTLMSREEAGQGDFGPQIAWTFEVEAVLAGDLNEVTTLTAPADDGANCGLNVGVGDRVGLILYSDGDGWSSSSCSTYDADAMLAAGDPQPPTDGGSPVAEPPTESAASSFPVVPIALAVLGAGVVLAAVVLLARRTRPTDV